ncbi:MAG: toll/interleukin-1 receptor domain-containing protein [Caldilineaceae bacterium]
MKIFISHSGEASTIVSEELRKLLPRLLDGIKPFASPIDMEKGEQWANRIAIELRETKAGIVCLTPDNLTAPWILFESGALSNTKELVNTRVFTYLIGVKKTDVKSPLSQFQHTSADREDSFELLKTINKALGESKLEESEIKARFDKWWSDLEEAIKRAKTKILSTRVNQKDKGKIYPFDNQIEELLNKLFEQTKVFESNPANFMHAIDLVFGQDKFLSSDDLPEQVVLFLISKQSGWLKELMNNPGSRIRFVLIPTLFAIANISVVNGFEDGKEHIRSLKNKKNELGEHSRDVKRAVEIALEIVNDPEQKPNRNHYAK